MQSREGSAVRGTKPLPQGETASVPATTSATTRYLFLLPQFKDGGAYDKDLLPGVDTTVTLKGVSRPTAVRLLGSGKTLTYDYADNGVTIQVPADVRTKLVDVVEVHLTPAK
jgi:alpha-L-fucosidase